MSINSGVEGINPPVIFLDPPVDATTFGGSRMLFREAARHFGVNLTEQEDHDWLVELGAAMLIDHLVDVEREDIGPAFRKILEGQLRGDLNSDVQVRATNYMARQSQEEQQAILQQVRQVNELAIAQRRTTRAKDVVDIRMAEADIFAAILKLDETDRQDGSARLKLNAWLEGFSRAGYALDTLFDMKEDFENGDSGVVPTAGAKIEYSRATSREALGALKKSPPSLIGKCAIVGVNYIFKQKRLAVQDS